MMKWNITYRDAAWLLLGVFMGIVLIYGIFYGYSMMFLDHVNINIGEIVIDINETKMVDQMYHLMNVST